MECQFEQIVEILGKRPAEHTALLERLERNLCEHPVIDHLSDTFWVYDYPKAGLSFDFDLKREMFVAVTFFIAENLSEHGTYSGNFPFEILRKDVREVVESKFPGCTTAVKDYRTAKDLRPLEFQFCYDSGGIQLQLISVDYVG